MVRRTEDYRHWVVVLVADDAPAAVGSMDVWRAVDPRRVHDLEREELHALVDAVLDRVRGQRGG